MNICGGCPRTGSLTFPRLNLEQKSYLSHLLETHEAYRKLQAMVKQAALNAGPGGWPKITDWVEVKKLAEAREPWTPEPRA